jgi:small-conductance mechanosensitive channel
LTSLIEGSTVHLLGHDISIDSIIIAVTILAVGVLLAKLASIFFKRYFGPHFDESTSKTISKGIYYGIIAVTLLAVTTSQGIDLSGLMVAGGIFGIVIGFATQSVVSNLVSGVFLMFDKPARPGHVIEIPQSNIVGVLMDIAIFSTRVRLFDGTIMRIPNDKIFTSNIRNISHTVARRADFAVGIAYKDNIDKAVSEIKKAVSNLPYVLIEPEPMVWTEQLGDSGVNLRVFVWYPSDSFGEVVPIMPQIIKESLDRAGIEIPFPQRVIWYRKMLEELKQ